MAGGKESGRHPNRQVGRSRLTRLTSLIAGNLEDEAMDKTVFLPDFHTAVSNRLQNYRQDRDGAFADNEAIDGLSEDTAREVNERFRNRRTGGDGTYR